MIYTAICGGKDLDRKDIKVFKEYSRFFDPRLNAKIYKILPHLFMDCEYSVWLDGNMYPLKEEKEYIALLGGNDIAVFKHPERNTTKEEADFCVLKEKDLKENIKDYPASKLYSCGFIIRRHTDKIKQLCEKWWAEICTGSVRDQISFGYVFKDEPITVIDKCIWANDLFLIKPHIK